MAQPNVGASLQPQLQPQLPPRLVESSLSRQSGQSIHQVSKHGQSDDQFSIIAAELESMKLESVSGPLSRISDFINCGPLLSSNHLSSNLLKVGPVGQGLLETGDLAIPSVFDTAGTSGDNALRESNLSIFSIQHSGSESVLLNQRTHSANGYSGNPSAEYLEALPARGSLRSADDAGPSTSLSEPPQRSSHHRDSPRIRQTERRNQGYRKLWQQVGWSRVYEIPVALCFLRTRR